jgi:3',5'-cyclic AMP phosphodiesterase CpdA
MRKYIARRKNWIIVFILLILLTAVFVVFPKKKVSQIDIPSIVEIHKDPVIVAVGDIVCDFETSNTSECQQEKTAAIIKKINPDAVLALGDLQYENGNFKKFTAYYEKYYGQFKNKTYPAVGNHEYETFGASGYFDYFGSRAGERDKGYYSFDIGKWHVVTINSNCWAVGGCQNGSTQQQWLLQDLRMHPNTCTLAFWHHPLVSVAEHGNNPSMKDIWQTLIDNHVDLVLNGHDHVYERFAKINSAGQKDEGGLREFVVGTGGRNLYAFKSTSQALEVSQNKDFGVLKLVLKPDSYSWEYLSTGKFSDKGQESCR